MVTVSQVFYAVGLILLVSLGDLVDRRRLIARLLAICMPCDLELPRRCVGLGRRLGRLGDGGRSAVCAVGAGIAALSLVLWLTER